MYERMTEQGRAVIDGAHVAAPRPGHDYVGTEHVLLALTHDPSGAALLSELGVDEEDVQAAIARRDQARPAPERPPPAALRTSG